MTSDPRLLRPFVALADELHFGRAAARLHITQPALSQQIARLERQVGVPLFERTRTRVELTEAGEAMLGAARDAVAAAEAADEAARSHARGEAGELRLGLSPGAHYLAQTVLADFAQSRPQVRVRAHTDSSGALAVAVAAGTLDLALGFCTGAADGVVTTHLRDDRVVLAVGDGHELAQRGAVELEALADETFALVDAHDGAGYNDAVADLCRSAGFEPRTHDRPRGPMAWETAVRTEGCVGLTTRYSAPSTARGITLLDVEPPATFPLELIEPGRPVRRPVALAFAAAARDLR